MPFFPRQIISVINTGFSQSYIAFAAIIWNNCFLNVIFFFWQYRCFEETSYKSIEEQNVLEVTVQGILGAGTPASYLACIQNSQLIF